jgi:hypothetical protein
MCLRAMVRVSPSRSADHPRQLQARARRQLCWPGTPPTGASAQRCTRRRSPRSRRHLARGLRRRTPRPEDRSPRRAAAAREPARWNPARLSQNRHEIRPEPARNTTRKRLATSNRRCRLTRNGTGRLSGGTEIFVLVAPPDAATTVGGCARRRGGREDRPVGWAGHSVSPAVTAHTGPVELNSPVVPIPSP